MRFKRLRSAALTLLGVSTVLVALNYQHVRGTLLSTPSGTERRLQTRLTKVQFDNVPLRKALDSFSNHTGLAFDADCVSLEQHGARPDHRIRLKLENVTVAAALDELLRSGLRLESAEPAYDVLPDGRIMIGSPEELRRCYFTRLYDLRDLVDGELRYRESIGPAQSIEGEMIRREVEYRAGTPAGRGLFQATSTAVPPPTPEAQARRAMADAVMDVVSEYAEIVSSNVASDDWFFNGGASINPSGQFLIVTHRPYVHRQIESLLAELRRTNTPIARIRAEPGQVERRKEGSRAGSGLFGN